MVYSSLVMQYLQLRHACQRNVSRACMHACAIALPLCAAIWLCSICCYVDSRLECLCSGSGLVFDSKLNWASARLCKDGQQALDVRMVCPTNTWQAASTYAKVLSNMIAS